MTIILILTNADRIYYLVASNRVRGNLLRGNFVRLIKFNIFIIIELLYEYIQYIIKY